MTLQWLTTERATTEDKPVRKSATFAQVIAINDHLKTALEPNGEHTVKYKDENETDATVADQFDVAENTVKKIRNDEHGPLIAPKGKGPKSEKICTMQEQIDELFDIVDGMKTDFDRLKLETHSSK